MKLKLQDFAQIDHVEIDFGEPADLAVLVGQQATGKSLVLQWLKLLTYPLVIRRDWERSGCNWKSADPLRPFDLFFGEGLGKGCRPTTRVSVDGQPVQRIPAGGVSRLTKSEALNIQTVILEEPDLGLHPKALFSIGVVVLHLMSRGYRVVHTHPHAVPCSSPPDCRLARDLAGPGTSPR